MREKLIVKPIWLSFLHLPPNSSFELQELILLGRLQSEIFLAKSLTEKLSSEGRSFVIEKTLQILGRPTSLLKSLENLPFEGPRRKKNLSLWLERVFLKGFALSRLGKITEAERWFQLLPESFLPRVQTEKALVKLNHGNFIEAEIIFKQALASVDKNTDPYSLCTLLGGLGLALIQQGAFREAELCLRRRRQVLKTSPSPTLAFGTRLYEILLLLEKNEFTNASNLLRGSLDEQSEDSINSLFLLHLKLRVHLARNELLEASGVLKNLKNLLESQKIPQGILDFRVEEVEWNLRSHRPEEALRGIELLEAETVIKQDFFLNFRLSLLKAQTSYQRGDLTNAFKEISQAIQQGEKRQYLPILTWALFHGAGIARAAGHPVQAKLYLQRGERLTNRLNLRGRHDCFSYMAEVIEQKLQRSRALLSLVRRQTIGAEMEYYLDSYNLLTDVSLQVSSRSGQELVAEPDFRRRFFKEPGLFWFQKEEILLANLGDRAMRFSDFSEAPQLRTAFRLFWNSFQNQDRGFSLKEIHQTRLSCTYREELHASATKMIITRIRNIIQHCGIKISYCREDGLYSLQSDLPPFTLLSREDSTPEPHHHRNREDEILSRIAIEPFVPTKVLCHEFGVSRQALHPFLKKLVAKKQVRLVKRGPISGYIFIEKNKQP